MINTRPLVLITNDDSIHAPGILRLVDCIPDGVDIIVAAPSEPRSGQSSALTVGSPLRINETEDYRTARMFTITGTPVDCVKLSMEAIVPRRPDLVLAGINHGSNSGCNVVYSGTMGAVLEGCIMGIPSCGFSLLHHSLKADFTMGMPFITPIIEGLLTDGMPDGVCLNVNIPARIVPEGVKVCRAANGYWTDGYKRYEDPLGKPFYWLTGKFINTEPEATDTDEYWLSKNYISAVPVACDMSARANIEFLSRRFDR